MEALTQPSLSINQPTSGRKLPIKRKPPPPSSPHCSDEDDVRRPPFKFHRIWTEMDELRFLQGLLDCRNQGLSFPRDLQIFYSQFSGSMPQPYSRSQLSEKLRRLRKKFRVVISRLSRGLQPSQLSSHDRALFDLSLRLWHPENSPISPFGKKMKNPEISAVFNFGFNCGNAPPVPLICDTTKDRDDGGNDNVSPNLDDGHGDGWRGNNDGDLKFQNDDVVDVDMNGVKKETDGGVKEGFCEQEGVCETLHHVIGRSIIEVFDECAREIRMEYAGGEVVQEADGLSEEPKMAEFVRRWREQQISELDVLCGRLRLVVEKAIVHS